MKKGQLLATLGGMRKEYSVSFMVLPTKLITTWGSILHLTIGGDNAVYGDRIPVVFFRIAPHLGRLYVSSAVNGKKSYAYSSAAPYHKANVWINIKVKQFKSGGDYRYQIFLDEKKVVDVVNNDPRDFKNVKVYAGNPWDDTQPGIIRNLVIKGRRSSIYYY